MFARVCEVFVVFGVDFLLTNWTHLEFNLVIAGLKTNFRVCQELRSFMIFVGNFLKCIGNFKRSMGRILKFARFLNS